MDLSQCKRMVNTRRLHFIFKSFFILSVLNFQEVHLGIISHRQWSLRYPKRMFNKLRIPRSPMMSSHQKKPNPYKWLHGRKSIKRINQTNGSKEKERIVFPLTSGFHPIYSHFLFFTYTRANHPHSTRKLSIFWRWLCTCLVQCSLQPQCE